MSISWRDAMSVGVSSLDNDHKKIIAIVNHVDEGIANQKFAATGKALEVLLTYVQEHFALEEAIMKRVGYPDLEFHQKLHKGLATRVLALTKAFQAATANSERRRLSLELSGFLQGWLVDHILKEDLRLKPYIPQSSRETEAAPVKPVPTVPPLIAGEATIAVVKSPMPAAALPPELAALLENLSYALPQMPPPAGPFSSFEALCDAAINRRANKILIFFQRHNPQAIRELPPFFLAAPEFAEKFRLAVSKFILPAILGNRQVRQLSVSQDWTEVNDEAFWDHLEGHLRAALLHGWDEAWDALKLVSVKKEDGAVVQQVKENTKELRILLAPSSPDAYDIPRIGNLEIETFKSLLDTKIDWWEELNDAWKLCLDLYEREKDPRFFQSRAQSGAMRDSLLEAFARFPESWCDFLILACHRGFPRVSTVFLESYVASIANTDALRESCLPYTVRYLRQAKENPRIRDRENREEIAYQAEVKKVRDFLLGRGTDTPGT